MSDACQLPEYKRCCCTCLYRLQDFHHCTTVDEERKASLRSAGHDGCLCSIPKGWICAPAGFEGRAHSDWSEHGICEMHVNRVE